MRLSSVSEILVLTSIVHGSSFGDIPLMNPMSYSGFVGSRVSQKAQRTRAEFMNIELYQTN